MRKDCFNVPASEMNSMLTHIRLDALVNMRFRAALFYFYFVLGMVLTFPVLPLKKILMDEFQFEPADMAKLIGIISSPWTVKPIYGFVSDTFPIYQLHRRPYLAIGLVITGSTWIIIGFIGISMSSLSIGFFLFCGSLGLCIADVSADSLVVSNVKLETKKNSGKLQSGCRMSRAFGSMLASAASGIALDHLHINPFSLLLLNASIAFSGLLAVLAAHEEKSAVGDIRYVAQSLKELLNFWKRPEIHRTIFFLFLFAGTPSAGDAYFYFMRNKLNFKMEFLGWLNVIRYASSIVGVWLFRQYLRCMPFRILLRSAITIAFALGMTTIVVVQRWNLSLGISDKFFVIGDTVALATCAEIASLPLIIISAKLAPKGAEGTVYASIISVLNLSDIFSEMSGGVLTNRLGVTKENYDNMWLLLLICNLSTLLSLPFLQFVPQLENSDAKDFLPVDSLEVTPFISSFDAENAEFALAQNNSVDSEENDDDVNSSSESNCD